MPPPDRPIDDLVAAAVADEPQARDALLTELLPVVQRHCRARLGHRETPLGSADDIAQDRCLSVVRALPRYQARGLPFYAFVYRIAAHRFADAYRAAARSRTDPTPEPPRGPAPRERAVSAARRAAAPPRPAPAGGPRAADRRRAHLRGNCGGHGLHAGLRARHPAPRAGPAATAPPGRGARHPRRDRPWEIRLEAGTRTPSHRGMTVPQRHGCRRAAGHAFRA